MSNQLNFDTRGKLTVRDTAGNPVKIIIKLAGRCYGNGRMVGDRQYQVCRHVEHINDRQSPAQLARRERFKAAVAAWRALPEAERRRLKPALPRQPPPARPAFPDLSATPQRRHRPRLRPHPPARRHQRPRRGVAWTKCQVNLQVRVFYLSFLA